MKTIRAISLGVLLWILIFVEISITMVGLKFSETTVWIIHYILLIPFSIFISWIYYKNKDKLNGFILGIIILITGIILDALITIPFFIIPQGKSYLDFFSNIYLLLGFIELILIAGVYDLIRNKR